MKPATYFLKYLGIVTNNFSPPSEITYDKEDIPLFYNRSRKTKIRKQLDPEVFGNMHDHQYCVYSELIYLKYPEYCQLADIKVIFGIKCQGIKIFAPNESGERYLLYTEYYSLNTGLKVARISPGFFTEYSYPRQFEAINGKTYILFTEEIQYFNNNGVPELFNSKQIIQNIRIQ